MDLSKRKPRPVSAPAMVSMLIYPDAEIAVRMAVQAMADDWATTDHFNAVVDVADMLLLAAADKNDAGIEEVAHHARACLQDIAQRWKFSKVVSATPTEAETLECLVDVSADFWRRQTVTAYRDAQRAVRVYRQHQLDNKDKRAA